MRLYFDACCLNRLTDDQSQTRVREETEAVERILCSVREGRIHWVSSSVLEVEVHRDPNEERRQDTVAILGYASETVEASPVDAARAQDPQRLGFSAFDALHLACAESAGAAVFLTTDDRLLRRAHKFGNLLRVQVENPVSWYKEGLA
jgi:predicted nucleic acid-binding protein